MNRRNYVLILAGGVTVAQAEPIIICGIAFTVAQVRAKDFLLMK